MHGNKGCLEKERIALLAIKPFIIKATVPFYGDHEDDHNRTVESWVDDRVSDCCNWYRIECSTTTSRVMNLSLSGLLYKSWVDSRAHHLKQLKILNLSGNRFDDSILSYLTAITSLTTLILNFSNLKDFNPTQGGGLGNLRNLEYLGLSGTSINVSLQELGGGLANLRNLEFLDLSSNLMSGSLQLANLRNLKFLDLSHNGMIGSLQELGICKFKNLIELDLSENNFEVESNDRYRISLEFGSAMEDKGYSGSSYNFTVAFKQVDYLAEFTKETEILFASKNRYETFEGRILYYMLGIDLSSNELTGDIPTEIGYLQEIIAMNLSRNSLSGSIPVSFSNLTNIESLDLSYNKLSGRIPPQLTQLNSLGTFNVSFNNLSGPVPDTKQFGTFVESSYGGNPGLCGPQIKRICGSSEPTTPSGAGEDQEDESAIHMVSFYWSLFASYVTTIMGFILILWLNSYWRKQWFCFIDECIISSYCWILRNIFHR
ncbi:hypothetical protein QYF36_005320 [Acer negundo]|nr:hypothetical protein QYF36_005320 [Acer negundo]